jgi:hypothetical protein
MTPCSASTKFESRRGASTFVSAKLRGRIASAKRRQVESMAMKRRDHNGKLGDVTSLFLHANFHCFELKKNIKMYAVGRLHLANWISGTCIDL